ncbi:MAG: inorganic phosphate transporter [Elusimicrobia bacterium]|nr:inorganic phosphate transporter [Elusimicrobiota bacterium]
MNSMTIIGIAVIVFVLIFVFTNGFNNSADIVATVISTRALSPRKAIALAAVCEFLGACFLGVNVAKTITKGIFDPQIIFVDAKSGIIILLAALIGSIFWNIYCTYSGFPISASHSLLGGLLGSVIFSHGIGFIHWNNVLIILLVMLLTPAVGFIFGYFFTKITYLLVRNTTPKINKLFRFLQIAGSMLLAFSHGSNDTQKSMGMLTLLLLALGFRSVSVSGAAPPVWVVVLCASFMAFGIFAGGASVIKTVGIGIYRIKQIHGFTAQSSSSVVLYISTILGYPVSSTHIVSTSIMGAGSADRIKAVKWEKIFEIIVVWFVTMPVAALVSGLSFYLLSKILTF